DVLRLRGLMGFLLLPAALLGTAPPPEPGNRTVVDEEDVPRGAAADKLAYDPPSPHNVTDCQLIEEGLIFVLRRHPEEELGLCVAVPDPPRASAHVVFCNAPDTPFHFDRPPGPGCPLVLVVLDQPLGDILVAGPARLLLLVVLVIPPADHLVHGDRT